VIRFSVVDDHVAVYPGSTKRASSCRVGVVVNGFCWIAGGFVTIADSDSRSMKAPKGIAISRPRKSLEKYR